MSDGKNDKLKLRYDLVPPDTLEGLVEVLTFGSVKYEDNGWRKLKDGKVRYYAALMRHLEAWRQGEQLDEETGESHLSHALCCVMFLSWLDEHGKG